MEKYLGKAIKVFIFSGKLKCKHKMSGSMQFQYSNPEALPIPG